jgi:MFS transporter, OPA family, sugar phosphate sensor protein UhpC
MHTAPHAGAKQEDKPSMIELLVTTVLKNPYIWGMALTYFFIYVIRQGVTSWCARLLSHSVCR